jgi:FKBP-type peptidyl-prolyl cis-trans isomerase
MQTRLFLVTGTLVAAIAVAACGGDKSSTAPATDITTTSFDASLNVHLQSMTKTASGLYYQDSIVGAGAAVHSGSAVTVGYTGWLANGTKFDGGSIVFTVGAGRVIAGWDEGLVGMKVGGIRKLVVPPSLGYGASANGPIPANSVLVFNVQVVASQ